MNLPYGTNLFYIKMNDLLLLEIFGCSLWLKDCYEYRLGVYDEVPGQ
jgi:hypothetical protein